ncbi:hypothetical protein BLNAU_4794 [Blattamonas nauphoetae]|uniref:Uncharacterized protein n=1 Tax=Blattamonas nauphoetae TaxID=2049346 RepID=A0ABQ9Y914_9EUKA|nr:hypothetical protein BLNAU_4794 [Blattamonas nauphoetae]
MRVDVMSPPHMCRFSIELLSQIGQQLPAGKGFSIVVKEMEGDVVKANAPSITLSGSIDRSIGLVTSCSSSVEIYGKTGTVEYGKKYQIVSLTANGKAGVADSTASFTVPDSPCRIETTSPPTLNLPNSEVSVMLIGASFSSSITAVTVKRGSTLINSKSVSFYSSTQIVATFASGITESTSSLAFNEEYEIHAISGLSESFINTGVKFTVPNYPVLTAVPFSFASSARTSFRLILEGTDLPVGETFLVSLKDIPTSITVKFETATTGSSTELPLGESHIFLYSTTYSLVSVVHNELSSISIPCVGLSFTTGARPSSLFLHVSSSGNDENEGIGSSPLRTLHKALVKTETESIEDPEMIVISDSCSIGELTEFGSIQEMTTVIVEGGEGRKIICNISEMEQREGMRMGQKKPMITLKRNTLSFSKLIFEMKKADNWIGSVFLVGEEGALSLESSEVRSSETISHRFVWIKKTGLFEGKELAITSISFGGKGSVMAVNEEGRLRLAACSFDGVPSGHSKPKRGLLNSART